MRGATCATCTDRRSSTFAFDRQRSLGSDGRRGRGARRPAATALCRHLALRPAAQACARAAFPARSQSLREDRARGPAQRAGRHPGGGTRAGRADQGAAGRWRGPHRRGREGPPLRGRAWRASNGAIPIGSKSSRATRSPSTSRLSGSAWIGIVANLPYNVGTRLLLRWLERVERIESMTLMFQREVAMRITATGGRDYGGLSVRAQWLCACERLFDVSPRAFVPPPGVVSTVVRLVPRATPLAPAEPGRPRCRDSRGILSAQEDAAPRASRPHPGASGAASERWHLARSAGRDAFGRRVLRAGPRLGGDAARLRAVSRNCQRLRQRLSHPPMPRCARERRRDG